MNNDTSMLRMFCMRSRKGGLFWGVTYSTLLLGLERSICVLWVLERNIPKASRGTPIIRHERIHNLAMLLKCLAQHLHFQRSGNTWEGNVKWFSDDFTLPFTDQGKFEQNSWVLENGLSVSGAAPLFWPACLA